MTNAPQRDYKSLIRKYVLATVDLLLILTALVLYLSFYHQKGFSGLATVKEKPFWFLLIVGVWIFYSYVFNLYDLARARKPALMLRNTAIVALLTGVTYLFIPFMSPNFPLHRMPAFVLIVYLVVPLMTWRLFFALMVPQPLLNRVSLIVGTGWQARALLETLTRNEEVYHRNAYRVLGIVPLEAGADRELIAEPSQGSEEVLTAETIELRRIDTKRVLAFPERLPDYVRRLGVEELILAFPRQEGTESALYAELVECEQAGAQLSWGADLYESVTGKMMVREQEGRYYLVDPYESRARNRFYRLVNRVLNIVMGLLGSLLTVLLIPLVGIANLLVDRGPLFYSQTRTGKNSRTFQIHKFRTMIVDAEKESGPQWSTRSDSRITVLGRILRRTRIDELPQCWNLLKGEMNLIGPRPERPVFVEELRRRIPFYNTRHVVKPGITGWAQVNYKYGSDYADALVKLQYDLYYIKHRSFLLDLRIMAETVGVVLKFKGT